MFRYAVLLSMLASPAWARCFEYTLENSLVSPAPRATICYQGECHDTELRVECGAAGGFTRAYRDGTDIQYDGEKWNAYFNDAVVDYAKLSCKEIDTGACFP